MSETKTQIEQLIAENAALRAQLEAARKRWMDCQNWLAEYERIGSEASGAEQSVPAAFEMLRAENAALRARIERMEAALTIGAIEFQSLAESRYGREDLTMGDYYCRLAADLDAAREGR